MDRRLSAASNLMVRLWTTASCWADVTALTANALSSVAGWTSLVLTFIYGFTSDRTQFRGPLIIAALALSVTFWIVFQQLSLSPDRWLKYGLQICAQGFNSAFHVSPVMREESREPDLTEQPVNATWLSLNCKTPQERSIAMAMSKSCGLAVSWA